ncbi:hypothetical protein EC957_006061 [Mortierella hygrophila]|uniref:Uncharacterized protein n=1 Tax=Mortierella hygrophila TaxID=979708 RepID=A0A9P6EZI6_9FUNG|nr:hypothetical protein EC957_006061 [Mortierella hygrophila]
MQNSLLNYTPSGTVEEAQMISWTVDTKQPFPIQGPFYDLAGYLFKPTLKRLNPKASLDLEIELMSSVSATTPLQVSVNVETMAPPGEKTFTHSYQCRTASLSDRNRTIEVKTMMTHDRWEASKGLRIEFKFDPIQRQRPRYDWLWNSSSTKDVEIRFSDPQVAPILVHKDLILEACPKLVNFVQVVNSNANAAGGDGTGVSAMAQGHGPTPPSASSSRPGSLTPTASPVILPQVNEHQRSGQEKNFMAMDESPDTSSLYRSTASSFVNISRDPSVYTSSGDDMSVTESDRSDKSLRRSEDALLEEAYVDESRPLLLARGGNDGLASGQQGDKQLTSKEKKEQKRLAREQQNAAAAVPGATSPIDVAQVDTEDDQTRKKRKEQKRLAREQRNAAAATSGATSSTDATQVQTEDYLTHEERKEQRRLAREQRKTAAVASSTTSPTDVTQVKTDDDQRVRKVKLLAQEQVAKQPAHQKDREKTQHSPLTHTTPGFKVSSITVPHQHQIQHLQLQRQATTDNNSASVSVRRRPEREIWHWPAQLHPELCTIIIRWIYFEEVPTHFSGSNYPLDVIEPFLGTFHCLDFLVLFQSFLATQIFLVEKNPNPMSFWKFAELAKQGGMVNRFFRPVIVKTTAKNMHRIIWLPEFGEVLGGVDPSGIFREALAGQPSPLARE